MDFLTRSPDAAATSFAHEQQNTPAGRIRQAAFRRVQILHTALPGIADHEIRMEGLSHRERLAACVLTRHGDRKTIGEAHRYRQSEIEREQPARLIVGLEPQRKRGVVADAIRGDYLEIPVAGDAVTSRILARAVSAAEELDRIMDGKRKTSSPILIPPIRIVERASTEKVPPAGFLIKEALEYIAEHVTEGITARDVAKHLKVSPSPLRLRFRTVHGRSVRDLILDARFAAVNNLLKTTRYGLYHIALKAGFSSANLLSHAYKARFGVSPARYRRQSGNSGSHASATCLTYGQYATESHVA